jgi:RsiW-degrading membrane proteinase PrsW (M82 family)
MSKAHLYLSWRGKTSGPYSYAEIDKMLTDDSIGSLHQISEDGESWQTITEFKRCNFDLTNKAPAERNSHLYQSSTAPFGNKTFALKTSQTPASPDKNRSPQHEIATARECHGHTGNTHSWLAVIFSFAVIKDNIFKIIFFFSLVPFIIASFGEDKLSGYLWGIYFCLGWLGVFMLLFKPRRQIWRLATVTTLFTIFFGSGLLLAGQKIPLISSFYNLTDSNHHSFAGMLAGFIFGGGLCEEFVKAIPILFFVRGKDCTMLEYIFLGIVSGLGFAIAEGAIYTQMYSQGCYSAVSNAENNSQLTSAYSSIIAIQLIRYISLPLLHAAWSGITAWFIAMAGTNKMKYAIPGGLMLTATLHGSYNTSTIDNSSLWHILVAAITFGILCNCIYHSRNDNANQQAKE